MRDRFVLTALSMILLGVGATRAVAQAPTLDVATTCRRAPPLDTATPVSGKGSGDLGAPAARPKKLFDDCIVAENDGRRQANDIWPRVKASDRANCVGLSSQNVDPSYVELAIYLQMYDPKANNGVTPDPAERKLPAISR